VRARSCGCALSPVYLWLHFRCSAAASAAAGSVAATKPHHSRAASRAHERRHTHTHTTGWGVLGKLLRRNLLGPSLRLQHRGQRRAPVLRRGAVVALLHASRRPGPGPAAPPTRLAPYHDGAGGTLITRPCSTCRAARHRGGRRLVCLSCARPNRARTPGPARRTNGQRQAFCPQPAAFQLHARFPPPHRPILTLCIAAHRICRAADARPPSTRCERLPS
jgi:hypothetical protein